MGPVSETFIDTLDMKKLILGVVAAVLIVSLLAFLVGWQYGINMATEHWQVEIDECSDRVNSYNLDQIERQQPQVIEVSDAIKEMFG